MAHRRRTEAPTTVPSTEGEVHERRHHNFTIELFLDEAGEVIDIFISHDQSEKREKISGWAPEQVIDFIGRHAGLQATRSELNVQDKQISAIPATNSLTHRPDAKRRAPFKGSGDLKGTLRLQTLSVVPIDSGLPSYLLPSDKAFSVRLTLDFTDVLVSPNAPLAYEATILAKQLGGAERIAGKSHAEIGASNRITISIPCTGLPQGMYRFSSLVKLAIAGMEDEHIAGIVAFLEGGGPIEVY
jgi:hypothetical protein